MAGANTVQAVAALRDRPSDRRIGRRRTADLTGWARVLGEGLRDAEDDQR